MIGIGLAMDAAAVSMTNAMVCRGAGWTTHLCMPLFFGAFQAMMPVLGCYAGDVFAAFITRYAGLVICLILLVIGGRMAKEGCTHMREGNALICGGALPLGVLLMQAVATSIDAFAVGISFSAARIDIWLPSALIGFMTAAIVTAAILIGRRFGDILGSRAELLGGGILIAIGLKALL